MWFLFYSIKNNYVNYGVIYIQVLLFGADDKDPADEIMQISLAFNHFGKGLVQRMPRCRFGFFHVLNNDYTHWIMYAIGGTSHPTIISQGNRFIAPPNPTAKMVNAYKYIILICSCSTINLQNNFNTSEISDNVNFFDGRGINNTYCSKYYCEPKSC